MQTEEDSLYIHWHLLDGINYDTDYSHEPACAHEEQYLREPLLQTAWRLMSWNRPQYIFHFTGGEPTIHPHFPELLAYVCNAGRNSMALIDTNGLRASSYYQSLFRSVPAGRLCVNLDIHPDCIKLDALLARIGQIAESGHFCRALLYHTPANAQAALRYYKKLAQFRKVIPFAFELSLPLGGAVAWQAEARAAFADAALPPLQMPGWAQPPRQPGPIRGFCCAGAASLHAGPDGKLTLGLACDDQPWRPVALRDPVFAEDGIAGPVFAAEAEAEKWLGDFRLRSLRSELECGIARHPLHAGFSPWQRLQIELQNVGALGVRRPLVARPECWAEQQDALLRARERLADEESRRVFAARLKAHLLGEGAYCIESPYPLFAHPALDQAAAEMAVDGIAPEINGADKRLAHCPEAVDAENSLHGFAWHMTAFGLELGEDCWLETLLAALRILPGHALYLGQHGDKTVLYGVPPQLRRGYAKTEQAAAGARPLLSVILTGQGAENELWRSLESVFAEAQTPREVVLACQDEDAVQAYSPFLQKYPGQIRIAQSAGADIDACLHAASGKYVCFAPWGETCDAQALDAAIEALEREGACAAMPEEAACVALGKGACAAMPEDSVCALKTRAGAYGAFGKIYKMAPVRELALAWQDAPDNEYGEMFNLTFAAVAGKVLFLPELAGGVSRRTKPELCRNFFAEVGALEACGRSEGLEWRTRPVRELVRQKFVRRMADFVFMAAREEYAPELALDERQLRILLDYGLLEMLAQKLQAASVAGAVQAEPAIAYALRKRRSGASGRQCRLSLVLLANERADVRFLQGLGWEQAGEVETLVFASKAAKGEIPYLTAYAEMQANVDIYVMEEEILPQQAFTLGLEKAVGEWIVFAQAGAELSPDYLQRLLNAIQETDAGDQALYLGKGAGAPSAINFADMAFRRAGLKAGAFCMNSPRWQCQFLATMPARSKNVDGKCATALALTLRDDTDANANYDIETGQTSGRRVEAPFVLDQRTPALLVASYCQEIEQAPAAALDAILADISKSIREDFLQVYALASAQWELSGLASLLQSAPEELQRAFARAYAQELEGLAERQLPLS